jgi:sec-independent protein translocase protein TatB
MFDVGFWEILLILVLALIVLGPERLPQAARTVGYWIGKGRRYIEGVKSEVEKEFDGSELKRMLHNQEVQIRELQGKLTDTEGEINRDIQNMADTHQEYEPKPEPRYEILEEDDEPESATPAETHTEQDDGEARSASSNTVDTPK